MEASPGTQRKRGRPSRFGNSSTRILDIAAEVLNEDGLSNASLDVVAERLGLSKSSLYYYIDSKETLVYSCYLRASQVRRQYAAEAASGPGSARDRFTRYLHLQANHTDPPLALIGDTTVLTPAHRDEIHRLLRDHDAELCRLLGETDGSLAPRDSRLVTFAVTGALNWGLVWERPGARAVSPSLMADAFADVLIGGLKPPGSAMTVFPDPIIISPSPLAGNNVFSRDFQASQRRDTLFRVASIFFDRTGYDNANLDEIVDYLGISKGALHHYVSSKEELLYGTYIRSLDLIGEIILAVQQEGGDGLHKLTRYIGSMIEMNAGPSGPVANFIRVKSLSPEHQGTVRLRSRALQRAGSGFFEQGIADGSIRTHDFRMARLALMGAVNWVPRWYSPGGRCTPREIATCFAGLFANGLGPRN